MQEKQTKFQKKAGKNVIKISMCVMWPLNIFTVLILYTPTCEHYTIALQQNTSK